MRFSDQFEKRFADMLTHYPTKRSVLVPTLLYAQDEVGYLSAEVIEELASGTREPPPMVCSPWRKWNALADAAGPRRCR